MGRPLDPKAVPYKATDGTITYRVRIRVNGRGTTETFPNEPAANVFINRCKDPNIGVERAIEMREREDTASPSYVPLVKELLVTHVESRTGVEERTRGDYLAQARRSWLPFIGEYRVDEVERADIARWINATAGSKAPKTIENEHGVLSGMMETAIELGYVTRNPAKRMKLPRAGEEDVEDPKFLSHAEFDILWEQFPEKWRPFVAWIFGTGTRFSETTAVQRRDIDLLAGRWEGDDWTSEPTVKIVRSWKAKPRRLGPPKSLASRRTIYLDPDVVVPLIEPLLDDIKPDDFVFRTLTGKAIRHSNFFNRAWKPATLRATICEQHRPAGCRCLGGFPERCKLHTTKDDEGHVILPDACGCKGTLSFRPRIHDARHTHASWLIAEGIPLEVIQERLGHEDYLTTKRLYGHLLPHAAADAARAASVSFARTSLGRRERVELSARPLLELT